MSAAPQIAARCCRAALERFSKAVFSVKVIAVAGSPWLLPLASGCTKPREDRNVSNATPDKVIAAAAGLDPPRDNLASISDEMAWIDESFDAAQTVAYATPISADPIRHRACQMPISETH